VSFFATLIDAWRARIDAWRAGRDGEDGVARIDDDVPADRQIHVDLHGLTDFANEVRGEVDRSVRPEAKNVFTVFEEGVVFGSGWWPSVDVRQAQERYHKCMTSTGSVLADYVNAAERMVVAAETVARRYGSADAFAAASADDIDKAFQQAGADQAVRLKQAADAKAAADAARERANARRHGTRFE